MAPIINKKTRNTTSRHCSLFQVAILMCVAFISGRFTQGGVGGGGGEGGVINLQTSLQTKEKNSVLLLEDNNNMIDFHWFNDDLIPSKTVLDMNIGTNYDPFGPQDDRYRILVDPLFGVCDSNAKLTSNVTSFCFAVSDYTGFATFNEYNGNGVSSSLAHVQSGTSHGVFDILSKRTVLVLEANILFTAIHRKSTQIHRLKLDLQGYELTVLRNIQTILRDTKLVVHVMAECFNPNEAGLRYMKWIIPVKK